MGLRAEKRLDKNNRLVTRHVRDESDSKQNAFLSLLKPLVNKEAREQKHRRSELIDSFQKQALAEFKEKRDADIQHENRTGDIRYDEGLEAAEKRIASRLKMLSLDTLEMLNTYPPDKGINEFTLGYLEEASESHIRERIMYPDSTYALGASEILHELTQTDDLTEFGEDTDEHHRIKAVYKVAKENLWLREDVLSASPGKSIEDKMELATIVWDHPDRVEEIIDFGKENWRQFGYKEGDLERLRTYLDHPVRALADGAL